MMLKNPEAKYRPFPAYDFSERSWPNRRMTKAPIWMSTDLRDGNQALIEPMNGERKTRMFEKLVEIGFKEIEVGFPSASQTDFDFIRGLIDQNRVPEDVTIEVLTQSREELIRRTIESVEGGRRVIVHMYNAIAPAFRRIVFGMSREEVKQIALEGTRLIKELTDARPDTEWVYQYSPEVFSSSELDFAKEVCDAVVEAWGATPNRKIILNLPATVECAMPNIYADQIEWMHRNLANRDSIILSVHPHNDRGTAVAAAEMAVLAGAERIEGCLFGHGERTGNVDLVTLALNCYSQGISPGLDFSDIDDVRRCVEYCTQLPVHPRHPYVGDLVFTAFSGSHQDAIKKGFAQRQPDAVWDVPYLPIDPADLGRSYDAVIRVNSQSGKGGVSYLLQQEYGFDLPRRLQIEFSRAIQRVTDETGKEVVAADVYSIFSSEYLEQHEPYRFVRHRMASIDGGVRVEVDVQVAGEARTLVGTGNGPIDAFVQALDMPMRMMDYHEHSIGVGADATAACYVEVRVGDAPTGFGVGVDSDIVTASFKAVLSAVNRHVRDSGQPAATAGTRLAEVSV
ncbi:2-isopropylmalate synthase [Pigmentiphaga sp. CHJ604]|uniref:2-isopropylmalate synthase n=1 Tax=Pigmentiphaga sp. CHJ604 TaxID=3081984 RepID=UPI0030D059F7